MKLTNNQFAFLTSATCGFLVWYFSKQITGNSEPWDGNFFAYLSCLLAIGFLCVYLFRSNLKAVYWGGYIGQALVIGVPFFGCIALGMFCQGGANLFPIGAVFLLVYSLPLLLGGAGASAIRGRQATSNRI
jgi:hypothetical protein